MNQPMKILLIGDTPAIHFITHQLSLLFRQRDRFFTFDCVSLYTLNQTVWVDACSGEHHVYDVSHVFRSFELFVSSHADNLIYDIVIIAATSYPLLKGTLQRLRDYTDKNTVILFDGFIGFSFEPLVYSILPECVCLTFFVDVIVKYVVPGYFVYQRLDDPQDPIAFNFGYTAIRSSQYQIQFTELKRRSLSYLSQNSTKLDIFNGLIQKDLGHQKIHSFQIKKFVENKESLTLQALIYKSIILMVTGDIFSIVNGQSDFHEILHSFTLKPVLDSILSELINLASVLNIKDITCGNPGVNSFKFFKDCLLKRREEEIKMTNPYKREEHDLTNCHHVTFGYFQRTETHAPIIMLHILVLCDYAGISTSSLTFLYAMFLRLNIGDFAFWRSRVSQVPMILPVHNLVPKINENSDCDVHMTDSEPHKNTKSAAVGDGDCRRPGSTKEHVTEETDSVGASIYPRASNDDDQFVEALELALAAADALAYTSGSEDGNQATRNDCDRIAAQNMNVEADATKGDPSSVAPTIPTQGEKFVLNRNETEQLLIYEDEGRDNYVLHSDVAPLLRSLSVTTYADAEVIANDHDFKLNPKLIPAKETPMSLQKYIDRKVKVPFEYQTSDKGPEVRNRLFQESKKRLSKGLKNPKIPDGNLHDQIIRREATLSDFLDDSLTVTTDRYGTAFMFPPVSRRYKTDHKK